MFLPSVENDSEGRQRFGAHWQMAESAVAASDHRTELDNLRKKIAEVVAADSVTQRQLSEFIASASQLQQPVSDIELQTKSLAHRSQEFLVLKTANETVEQCVIARSQALDEIKGSLPGSGQPRSLLNSNFRDHEAGSPRCHFGWNQG
jgi:hypothetical protein